MDAPSGHGWFREHIGHLSWILPLGGVEQLLEGHICRGLVVIAAGIPVAYAIHQWKGSGLVLHLNKLENEFQSGIIQGETCYSVHATLCAKFENAQEVQEIITGGRATLWKKRWWLRPKRLAESFHASVRMAQGGYVHHLPPDKTSLTIAPRTVSDEWRFMFAMSVPREVNVSDDSLFVQVRLDTLGSSNVTVKGPVPRKWLGDI
jgi:hypothetical protein